MFIVSRYNYSSLRRSDKNAAQVMTFL